MEQLSARLANKISVSLGFDQQKEQVLKYGFTAMLQFFSLLLIVMVMGLLGNFTYEGLIIFLGVGFLRKSTGGSHSGTMKGCMIMSCVNIALLSILSRYVLLFSVANSYYLSVYIACFILCFIIVYNYVPLDSPNKRITSAAKIARLRKQSFTTLSIYFVGAILFSIFSSRILRFQCFANSFCLLSLWQCFTVTPAGEKFIRFLDDSIF